MLNYKIAKKMNINNAERDLKYLINTPESIKPVILAHFAGSSDGIGGNTLRRYIFHLIRVNDETLPISEITREVALVMQLRFNKDETATLHYSLLDEGKKFTSDIAAAIGYAGLLKLEVT
jgi:hypothetical protein